MRPMPIPLFQSPRRASEIVDQAELLADICDAEFKNVTGLKNVIPSRGPDYPICCIGRENDYWTLECNDCNFITDNQRYDLATAITDKWSAIP